MKFTREEKKAIARVEGALEGLANVGLGIVVVDNQITTVRTIDIAFAEKETNCFHKATKLILDKNQGPHEDLSVKAIHTSERR
ncbi:MAG: hypothetical protein AAGA16_14700 [Cyanobacteria bacterium P01_E01_bin.35]